MDGRLRTGCASVKNLPLLSPFGSSPAFGRRHVPRVAGKISEYSKTSLAAQKRGKRLWLVNAEWLPYTGPKAGGTNFVLPF